jgi:hypothetical protein
MMAFIEMNGRRIGVGGIVIEHAEFTNDVFAFWNSRQT